MNRLFSRGGRRAARTARVVVARAARVVVARAAGGAGGAE